LRLRGTSRGKWGGAEVSFCQGWFSIRHGGLLLRCVWSAGGGIGGLGVQQVKQGPH